MRGHAALRLGDHEPIRAPEDTASTIRALATPASPARAHPCIIGRPKNLITFYFAPERISTLSTFSSSILSNPRKEKNMPIVIDSVNKSYGEGEGTAHVLKDVSCTIEDSEICVIIGASGSGKSTLLNCLGGLDRPDSGTIKVNRQDIASLHPKDLTRFRRKQIGFVFQFYNLVPNLTVRENIEVCEYLTSNPLPLRSLIDSLGLTAHQDKFPSQLSGGQQQRCAVARALVKRPRVLLCDEPTGALDYTTSKEMLELLERVNREHGVTVVIVSHNKAITAMAHRTITIRDGRIRGVSVQDAPEAASTLTW